MVSLYFRQLKSKWFFLFIISIGVMNIYFYQDSQLSKIALENWIISGNFITTFVNNAFFIFSLNRVKIFQNINDACKIRIKTNKLVNNLFIIGLINVIIYVIFVYSIIVFVQFDFINNILILMNYIFFTVLIFLIYEVLYMIVILDKKKYYLLFCPFIFNLVFHYIFIL